jgi:hypothetical protein
LCSVEESFKEPGDVATQTYTLRGAVVHDRADWIKLQQFITQTLPIIVLERESDAFQVSPEYRLSIFDDCTVLFQGKKHVKSRGAG